MRQIALARHVDDGGEAGAMDLSLAEVAAGWPLAASLAALRPRAAPSAGRRRTALNEALHELRRPLQALALAGPPAEPDRLAVVPADGGARLERLDREINGGPAPLRRAPRQRRRCSGGGRALAGAGGGSRASRCALRLGAGSAAVIADRCPARRRRSTT